jgi:hypothetical protein
MYEQKKKNIIWPKEFGRGTMKKLIGMKESTIRYRQDLGTTVQETERA